MACHDVFMFSSSADEGLLASVIQEDSKNRAVEYPRNVKN